MKKCGFRHIRKYAVRLAPGPRHGHSEVSAAPNNRKEKAASNRRERPTTEGKGGIRQQGEWAYNKKETAASDNRRGRLTKEGEGGAFRHVRQQEEWTYNRRERRLPAT
jgi:hypothetical protein